MLLLTQNEYTAEIDQTMTPVGLICCMTQISQIHDVTVNGIIKQFDI